MLGDFVTGSLTLLLGYVYPAFECFKTIEKNRVQIESLRFWCKYWIIVALLTAFEGVGSILVSWLPMYDEFKLAFFVYLWHQKTEGASYVYDTVLLPYIASHEWDLDHNILELRTKAGRVAVLYLNTVAEYGQSRFFELLQLFSSSSPKSKTYKLFRLELFKELGHGLNLLERISRKRNEYIVIGCTFPRSWSNPL